VRVFHSDEFDFPLPKGHRFPLTKFRLLRQELERAGLVAPGELIAAPPLTDEEILRVHDPGYLERLKAGQLSSKEVARIGLPWSTDLVERARRSAGGTLAACRAALEDGMAVNLAGGTHHAFRDRGQGYCLFNDCVIAVRVLQDAGLVCRAVILDCDVHQGNGTAALAAGDETVFTFSIHSESNFPLFKEQSDLDIALEDGTGDEVYLAALERGVHEALDRAGADLAIYVAGADPHESDLLGHLALTKAGLAARDRLVLELCLAARLPVAVGMGGGYGRWVEDTVEIHTQTVRIASQMLSGRQAGDAPKTAPSSGSA
jgi:acetoin utilization deacetylase AcuC-like enzyme